MPRLFKVTNPGPAHFFLCIFNCDLQTLSSSTSTWLCCIFFDYFRGIDIELYGSACDIKINEIEYRWQWCLPFSHVQIVCNFLIFCCFISFSILVVLCFMKTIAAPKRVLCALGIVCDACGKQFATSDGFDQHRTSGYLIGTPCHVVDDGFTHTHLVSSERATMTTAVLQKLKMDKRKHGTARALLIMLMTVYFTYLTYDLLMKWGRGGVLIIFTNNTTYLLYLWLLMFTYCTYDAYFTYDLLFHLLLFHLLLNFAGVVPHDRRPCALKSATRHWHRMWCLWKTIRDFRWIRSASDKRLPDRHTLSRSRWWIHQHPLGVLRTGDDVHSHVANVEDG